MTKEITKFRKKFLNQAEKDLQENVEAEDLEDWVWMNVGIAIDKAYKIGIKEGTKK